MLKNQSLVVYTKLFSPNECEKKIKYNKNIFNN